MAAQLKQRAVLDISTGGGIFTKTVGEISSNDVALGVRNIAQGQGLALYWESGPARWRNATAGPADTSNSYGFWMNN